MHSTSTLTWLAKRILSPSKHHLLLYNPPTIPITACFGSKHFHSSKEINYMAFRAIAVRQWRSILANSTGQNRSFSSSAGTASRTSRKYATTARTTAKGQDAAKSKLPMGDMAPIMIMAGFVVVVLAIATHCAWQQLAYNPGVQLRKKKRETLPEVYFPDTVLGSGHKFIDKSFLRKVGRIQDNKQSLEDPSRPNPFTHSKKMETPK